MKITAVTTSMTWNRGCGSGSHDGHPGGGAQKKPCVLAMNAMLETQMHLEAQGRGSSPAYCGHTEMFDGTFTCVK